MKTIKSKQHMQLEPTDYFFVTGQEDDYTLILTGNDGHPQKFSGITKRQLYNLNVQIQKTFMGESGARVLKIFTQVAK